MNKLSGEIELAQVFEIHNTSEEFENFIEKFEISINYIIIAGYFNCNSLSIVEKVWFSKLGSKEIMKLEGN